MKILSITENSIGAQIGLKPGDSIESIDGSRVRDVIDYRFKVSDDNILLRVRQNGAINEYEIEKDYDDDLGLEFEDFRIKKCANDCVFCFVDQNPPGMRDGLYFRDGDFRLSFLHGHFITMTNMGWKQLKRIVQQKLSPLYISVHATDPDKRNQMLLYGKDDYLLKKFELSLKDFKSLSDYAKQKNIIFMCTPWDKKSVDNLEKLDVPAYKIASADLTNIDLIEHVLKTKKPLKYLISMSSFSKNLLS